ncbi:MAG: T9SS type A sorting domain-containing protein [Ignavibacteriaceae bacterium]
MHKQIGIGGDLFIDDMCIYAGAVDNLAPDPATNPLVASGSADGEINVSWTAPGTGTDNGGYLVLRRDGAAPTSTPNVNGIYAVTNIIGDGTVAYIGTATSFTDASLMIGNTYYYVIYTYDKAYNYSSSTSVSSALPLPVELTSFSASAQNKTVSLTWQTATEVNNYGFEIQKSEARSKNTEWLKVGFVNGAGNSNSPKEYSFTDKSAIAGKYLYRLKQLDNDGQYKYSKEVEVGVSAPLDFSLAQNYPNPFNPSTSIQYSVTGSQNVTLKVFNVIGKEVAVLVNEKKEPGTYTVEFSSANLSSGTYFYRLQSGAFIQTKKMVILK